MRNPTSSSFTFGCLKVQKKLQMTTEAIPLIAMTNSNGVRIIPEFPKLQFSQEKQLSRKKHLA
jgi:hypothetical protein